MTSFSLASLVGALIGFAVAIAVLLAVVALVARRRRQAATVAVPEAPAPGTFAFTALDTALPQFSRRSLRADRQSTAWREAFADTGRRLASGGVRTIYYAHGTFVGHDPAGIERILRGIHPTLGERLAPSLRRLIKRSSTWITRDLGNFTPKYIEIAHDGLAAGIDCRDFRWSSGNTHFARLEGALALLLELQAARQADRTSRKDRVLLFGHSHAGQVFALLTQMLAGGALSNALRDLAEAEKLLPPGAFAAACADLRDAPLDFVTLGTAPVYPWALAPHHRLMHVINHRGKEPNSGAFTGVLITRDGDYIQQYALSGSDTLALTKHERTVNAALDGLLGRGFSMTGWVANLRSTRRLATQGFTWLVDFRDASRVRPNFLHTFFGHGGYTRYEAMLYLHRLVASHFY
jgi:hypothetical protein